MLSAPDMQRVGQYALGCRNIVISNVVHGGFARGAEAFAVREPFDKVGFMWLWSTMAQNTTSGGAGRAAGAVYGGSRAGVSARCGSAAGRVWGTLHPFYEGGGGIMGRVVANAGWLQAFLQADPYDAYHFFLQDEAQCATFMQAAEEGATAAFTRGALQVMVRPHLERALAAGQYHCFHLSDPVTEQPHLARLRNVLAPRLFPVTGVTHSLSYASYPEKFLAHLWRGCTPRDGVVATSAAGKAVVERLFASLRAAYGMDPQQVPGPCVPTIPLGVDPATLPVPDGDLRVATRARYGVEDDTTLVLVVGRICHYAKMDLLPLLRAAVRAEQQLGRRGALQLVFAGYVSAGDDMPDQLMQLARAVGLRCTVVASPDMATRNGLYAAADVFCSPSDSVQETFGLTLLEAAAAGLPVVASDWDGYRDLVLHGETGILVPTTGPQVTGATNALARVVFDNQYHLRLAQQVAVDVGGLAQALAHLAAAPDVRRSMGRAGRNRVLGEFAWEHVIGRWVALWDDLWSRPVDDGCRQVVHPLHMDFAHIFGTYPTQELQPQHRVCITRTGEAVYRGVEHPVLYGGVEPLVDGDLLHHLLFVARKPVAVADVLRSIAARGAGGATPSDSAAGGRAVPGGGDDAAAGTSGRAGCTVGASGGEGGSFLLLWALKHDLLEYCS